MIHPDKHPVMCDCARCRTRVLVTVEELMSEGAARRLEDHADGFPSERGPHRWVSWIDAGRA